MATTIDKYLDDLNVIIKDLKRMKHNTKGSGTSMCPFINRAKAGSSHELYCYDIRENRLHTLPKGHYPHERRKTKKRLLNINVRYEMLYNVE